ncbi:MAG: gliding motility-associated C-terminal domain-containing protein [Bacteroidota bacterium]
MLSQINNRIILLLYVLTLGMFLRPMHLFGQQFLNGSFELSGIPCRIALSSGGFNSHVKYVKSIGNNTERNNGIDLLTSNCGLGSAQDGEYFVGINITGDHKMRDIVSLEMDQEMKAGQSYLVEFYYKAGNRFANRNVLDIGLSNSNKIAEFGTKVHTIRGSSDSWQKASFQFVAPLDGRHLTLKLKIGNRGKLLIDNFSVQCPQTLELGADTSYCYVRNISLQPKGDFDFYYWQDRSEGPEFIANGPGLYWVEAQRGDCRLRDSIYLSEIDRNCECQFYTPNAFSPNRDGVNDIILPVTDCELSVFDFRVYDRWGQMIFRSQDRNTGWNGRFRNQLMTRATYIYQLIYQFSYQENNQVQKGSFILFD